MANVLIVDDDKMMCDMLTRIIKRLGHDVLCANSIRDSLELYKTKDLDIVFLDVQLPDGSGLEILSTIKESRSKPEIIIITGFGDREGAELAIRSGAWDYIKKPASVEKLMLQLERVLEYRRGKQKAKPPAALRLDGIVGTSTQIQACFDMVACAANSDANVLIYGETGTGKERFARAIHDNSPRADKSFVIVDCAALPENLVESMLMGYEKGAFTGADKAQTGLIKQAHGGTLFLDEVGELPLPIQKAFLRVLQEHRFRPLGASKEVESNFRLVAATNRDLDQMVKNGQFRKDLLYRLRAFTIEVPALRKRTTDIKDITMYHLIRFSEYYGMETKGIAPDFFDALAAYKWPGNVRELVNTLETVLVEARHEPTLFQRHLPAHIRIQATQAAIEEQTEMSSENETRQQPAAAQSFPTLREFRQAAVERAEKQYLIDLMTHTKGDIQRACRFSALGRSRLYDLLKKYKIQY